MAQRPPLPDVELLVTFKGRVIGSVLPHFAGWISAPLGKKDHKLVHESVALAAHRLLEFDRDGRDGNVNSARVVHRRTALRARETVEA